MGIILFITLWLLSGLVTFVILAKCEGYTEVDKNTREMFGVCLIGGVILLAITIFYEFVAVGFDRFIEWLLKKINGDKKNE